MKGQVREASGSILITLLVTITLLSALTAGILSFSASSSLTTVNVSNINRAHHLAESGMRYSKLVNLSENSYLTVLQNGNGLFQIFDDSSSPSDPQPISTSGFRIAYDDCRLQSTGIIGEGTLFEVSRTLEYSYSASLPCYWSFNLSSPNPVLPLKDEYSGNLAFLKGAIQTCEGKIGRGIFLDGGDYGETDFQPFCGIGNGNSFTVAFWANPDPGSEGTVLGVNDGESRFSFGIKGNNWMWAYGDQEGAGASVDFGQWQFVSVSFDAFTKILKISMDNCSASDVNPNESENEYDGSEILPEGVKNIFLGAENKNGNPNDFFNGMIDEVRIYQGVVNFEDRFCPKYHTVAYYPFSGNADDESLNGETFDGEVVGAEFDGDRFGCPGKSSYLDGYSSIKVNQTSATQDIYVGGYPFSISAWFKAQPTGSSNRVVVGIADENAEILYGIYLSAEEDGRVCLRAGDVLENSRCSLLPVDDDKWHFVAGVFADEDEMTLYLDGEEIDSDPLSLGFPFANLSRLTIGKWDSDIEFEDDPGFRGSIDEVAIYDEVLSSENISQLSRQRLPE